MNKTTILQPLDISNAALFIKVVHDVHLRATALLVDAAQSGSVPDESLANLRDFVVAELRYRQDWEERLVWPAIRAGTTAAQDNLLPLTTQHVKLGCAISLLERVIIGPGGDRGAVARVAGAVCDRVRANLRLEETVLFPLLTAYLPDISWDRLARQIMADSPKDHAHIMIGLLDRVADPVRVRQLLSYLPEPARMALSVRGHDKTTLAFLEVA